MSARVLVLSSGLLWSACGPDLPDPTLQADELLRTQLGLTDRDEVHTVTVTSDGQERSQPSDVAVPPGSWLQFRTADGRIHEVIFELDSMGAEERAFLERTDQAASPPLMSLDSRFVISFEGAPVGRYPYRLEGNGAPGRGVVSVAPRGGA